MKGSVREAGMCRAALLAYLLFPPHVSAALLDFTTIPMSVQQDGVGDVSALANDVMAAWSNPAWLARVDSRATGSVGGGGLYSFGETELAAGAAYAKSPWRMGLLVSYFGVSYPEVSGFGEATGGTIQQTGLGLEGVGSVRWGWFAPGLGLKMLSARLADMSESHFVADVGAVLFIDPVRIGACVSNLVAGGVPMQYRAGAACVVDSLKASFGAEVVGVGYSGAKQPGVFSIGAGADWRPARYLVVRVGVGGIGNQIRVSFGLTAFYRDFGLDAVFGTHPVGLTSRASLSYAYLPGAERDMDETDDSRSQESAASAPQSASAASQPTQSATAPAVAAAPPPSADAIFQQASELYAAANYNGAWGQAVEALKVDPRHWQSWQMIGNCQYALGDKAGAMSSYQTCLQLNPGNTALKTWLDQQNR